MRTSMRGVASDQRAAMRSTRLARFDNE